MILASDFLLARIFLFKKMKYILITISVLLIIYALYGIINCFLAFGSLTNYGTGVLAGGFLILLIGVLIMRYSFKLINKKNIK